MKHDVTDTLEKIIYWMDQSKQYSLKNDPHYSGICFDKAHTLAEQLLSMYISNTTFLDSSEREYLENILGKEI